MALHITYVMRQFPNYREKIMNKCIKYYFAPHGTTQATSMSHEIYTELR